MEEKEKHFEEWIVVKSDLHGKGVLRDIKDGDVYWCAVGESVGVEINGKSETFARPVVVLKKLSKYGFMGVPLTSQEHNGSWYAPFVFKNRQEYAVLAQARVFSVSRLYKKMGALPDSDLQTIRIGFHNLFC
ncbi:type II toxin-antitoxin system PemK/MazF family toxin [Candidatus Saccharibacteria bacterium]|nr:type II toxin-antitoxin system PemK/MazF family toxin [Candidatus Saccharibacteria bacterium]